MQNVYSKHHTYSTFTTFFLCAGALLLVLSGCTKKPSFETPDVVIERPAVHSASAASAPSSVASVSSQSTVSSRPGSLVIRVPFAPQSPFANWDAIHEDACEEMSLIMVHHFIEGTKLSLENAETEVQSMIAWEEEHGYKMDVSVSQLGEIAAVMYDYHVRTLTDVTADTLRRELSLGNPVIIPAAGRALHNPYFSNGGPFYHMLVVTGYNAKGFITNDPGTKQGEQYFYTTDVLMNALHDWTGVKEEIATGAKTALVVEL